MSYHLIEVTCHVPPGPRLLFLFISKSQLCVKGASALRSTGYPRYPPLLSTGHLQGLLALSSPGSQGLPGQYWGEVQRQGASLHIQQLGLKGDCYTTRSLAGSHRKRIYYVFQTAEGEVLPLPLARIHEVCTLAASLAFRAVWTRRSFCQPAWASHATFSDVYLEISPF